MPPKWKNPEEGPSTPSQPWTSRHSCSTKDDGSVQPGKWSVTWSNSTASCQWSEHTLPSILSTSWTIIYLSTSFPMLIHHSLGLNRHLKLTRDFLTTFLHRHAVSGFTEFAQWCGSASESKSSLFSFGLICWGWEVTLHNPYCMRIWNEGNSGLESSMNN